MEIVVHHRGGELDAVDQIVAPTGFRRDLAPLWELHLALEAAAITPLIDTNFHSRSSCSPRGGLSSPIRSPDFYIAGSKSYGRAPTSLVLAG